MVLQDPENLKQNCSVISCSRMAVGKDGKKAMKPLSSVTLNNSCYPEFFYFLHEVTCTFPDAVSGISLSILVLALHLIDINWLFLSSLFSSLFHFLASYRGVEGVFRETQAEWRDENSSLPDWE